MTGISKLTDLAFASGWALLGIDARTHTFYKWLPNTTRAEVHVVCDAAGRVEAVSLWHNQRQTIHHQPGVRAEAERLLSGGVR